MPPITNQQRRDFTKKVDLFEKKLASITPTDLVAVSRKDIVRGNNTTTINVHTKIEEMVQAYNELYDLDQAAFKQNREHLNADRQLKAFYDACEKLGIHFWFGVKTGTPDKLVEDKIAASKTALEAGDREAAATSIYETFCAIRKNNNRESYLDEIKNLYHSAEEKFGYDVFCGTNLSFGRSYRQVGFELQMESFEKMLENYDPKVHTDLKPIADKFEAAYSCARDDSGAYFDKERCDKAINAAVDKIGIQFCHHLSAVPKVIVDKQINSFTMSIHLYDKSEDPEKAQHLTDKFLETVRLILRNPNNGDLTEKLITTMYDSVNIKCGEAFADRIAEIDGVSDRLPNLLKPINDRLKKAEQTEHAKQAEQEEAAGITWREKWEKPLKIVNELFLDPTLRRQIGDVSNAVDKDNQIILNTNEDRSFLDAMAVNADLLSRFATKDYHKPIDAVMNSVYEDYAKAREHFAEEISSGEVGSLLYKTRLDALTACGAMGVAASSFISVAKANSLGFENAKDVDPMKPLRETLTVLRDEMERIPKSGNDTRLYTNLRNALNGVVNNENGASLEELRTAAEQYFNARKGVIFSPFTAAGKQRLDIANRVIGFLDVARYKTLEAKSNVKEDEPEVKAKNEVKENAKTEAPKSQVKTEATKPQVKTEATKPQVKTEAPKPQVKTEATNLSETVYDKIHKKCINLTRDKNILTFDQALAIDVKADAGTFAQKDYLNGLLDKEDELKELARKYPEKEAFERALDGLLEEFINAPATNAKTAVNVGYALETNEAEAQQTNQLT